MEYGNRHPQQQEKTPNQESHININGWHFYMLVGGWRLCYPQFQPTSYRCTAQEF
jgi:hypothetical protein